MRWTPARLVVLVAICAAAVAGAERAFQHGRDVDDLRLAVDPDTPAAAQARAYATAGDEMDAARMRQIARQPTAAWLADAAGDVRHRVARLARRAARSGAAPVIVLYAIPHRDCGGASSGGATDADRYRAWVDAVAAGIGDRRAIVIVEPDATAQLATGCVTGSAATEREALLSYAITRLKSRTGSSVYLDAGNPGWVSARQIAPLLRRSGVLAADGFAVNVGNFYTTAQSRRYGHELSRRLRSTHFVIDTSRNGNGPYSGALRPRWCNPPGRALGAAPTTETGDRSVDALLWVKYPGASDGACRPGEPPAGVWWPAYALELARGESPA